MDAWLEAPKACRDETEACLEKREPNLEEMEAVAEHQEVFNREDAVEKIGALEDRYGNQCLFVRRHGQLKKWRTKDNVV
jgi:hypothetical protein